MSIVHNGVKLPSEPRERIRVMVDLMHGKCATFVEAGERVRIRPQGDHRCVGHCHGNKPTGIGGQP